MLCGLELCIESDEFKLRISRAMAICSLLEYLFCSGIGSDQGAD